MHSVCASRVILAGTMVSAWVGLISAQQIRVAVKVSADDDVKPSLQKCLEDELLERHDVLLGPDAPDLTVSVIALKVVTRASTNVGITFSVLVTAPSDQKIREFAELHVAPEHRAQLLSLVAETVKPLAHWVETAASGDLPEVCESIVKSLKKDISTQRRKTPR